jgi:hypothetical protein
VGSTSQPLPTWRAVWNTSSTVIVVVSLNRGEEASPRAG